MSLAKSSARIVRPATSSVRRRTGSRQLFQKKRRRETNIIGEDDNKKFKESMIPMISHSLNMYFQAIINGLTPFGSLRFRYNENRLYLQTMHFAGLANFVALLGGKLKSEQYISGTMADILSNLYLGHSIIWYEKHNKISTIMRDYCVDRLREENVVSFNKIVDNFPMFRFLLYPFKLKSYSENFEDKDIVINELLNNKELLEDIKRDVQIVNTPLEDLEQLDYYMVDSPVYNALYSKVISVGETKNDYNSIIKSQVSKKS